MTTSQQISRYAGILFLLSALGGCGGGPADGLAAEFNSYASSTTGDCFDDDRLPHNWNKHGNPIDPGIQPGNGSSNNFYYYLNANMCSKTAHAQVWTTNGRWRVTIFDGFNKDNPLADETHDAPFEVTASVSVGQFIRARFANVGSTQAPDHASLYSDDNCSLIGAAKDVTEVATGTPCNHE